AAIQMDHRISCDGAARFDAAAVGRDATRKHAQPGEQRGYVGGRRCKGSHGFRQVSSRISLPSGGRITLLRGASVGTPIIRKADPVTLENTGAATAPPECC